jgi:hypothetical protein
MKLYTEEQVLKFINDNFDEGCSQLIGLTPIELPSDEDIIKDSKYKSLAGIGWIEGAKWMRDKIQGGNK